MRVRSRRGVAAAFLAVAALCGCAAPEKLIGANWSGPPETAAGQEFTPEAATEQEVAGYAVLQCLVGDGQALSACRVLHEYPAGWGFGDAAMRTRSGVKIRERQGLPYTPARGEFVAIPVVFCPSGQVPTCHPQMRAAFVQFTAGLEAVFGPMRAGDCAAAAKAASDLDSPRMAQIVRNDCRARDPKAGPAG